MNVLQTVVREQSQGTGTTGTTTTDVPRAHAISVIRYKMRWTHASAITGAISKVELLINGNKPAVSMSHAILRKINKHLHRVFTLESGAGGAEHIINGAIYFGRDSRDTMALPGGINPENRALWFQSVQLQLTWDTGGTTPTGVFLTVTVEENRDLDGKATVAYKYSALKTYTPAASQPETTEVPRGVFCVGISVDYADADNVDGDNVVFGVDNFALRLFDAPHLTIEENNRQDNDYDDATLPPTNFYLDLDKNRAGEGVDTSSYADTKLQLKADTTGLSGTVTVSLVEIVGFIPAA
jgi:hypothetical protein